MQSPNFVVLPTSEAVAASLGKIGFRRIKNISLFPFSSCNPTIRVELGESHEGNRIVVMRGKQQNDLFSPLYARPRLRSLEKDVYVLKAAHEQAVTASRVLFGGTVFETTGIDKRSGKDRPFPFILTTYVPGMAADRKLRGGKPAERLYYLDRIARIYARLHTRSGKKFGAIDRDGRAAFGTDDFEACLRGYFGTYVEFGRQFGDHDLADALARFSDRVIPACFGRLADSGHVPRSCLVYYDGFGGNMLIQGRRIGLVDPTTAGFFDPAVEFCAVVFGLRGTLLTRADGKSLWQVLVDRYRFHGGVLPANRVLPSLMQVLLVNLAAHNYVYLQTHRNEAKRKNGPAVKALTMKLMAAKPTMTRLVAAIGA